MKLHITKTNVITFGLPILSLAILATTFYLLSNVKVLENWKLIGPTNDVHVGDTVVVQSTYNKVRDASGESVRYITCKNRSGVWIRYELNRATSDRAKGVGGTGIPLTIRRDIADVPATCKFDIAIKYDGVLPFKSVNVYQSTKNFLLLPEREDQVERSLPEPQATTQSNLSQEQPVILNNSYSNTTLDNSSEQSNNSQLSQPSTTPGQNEPTPLLTRVLSPVINLLGGL